MQATHNVLTSINDLESVLNAQQKSQSFDDLKLISINFLFPN